MLRPLSHFLCHFVCGHQYKQYNSHCTVIYFGRSVYMYLFKEKTCKKKIYFYCYYNDVSMSASVSFEGLEFKSHSSSYIYSFPFFLALPSVCLLPQPLTHPTSNFLDKPHC